jgi:hypothetical protein
MTRERDIQDAIRLAVPPELAVFWRNNVGIATYVSPAGTVCTVRYGLAPGSADLVGIRVRDGRFVALEVKQRGQHATPEQQQWLALVRKCGGIAAEVHSVAEALEALAHV